MGAEKKLLPIREAFQLAQQPHQNQAKLVVTLSRTYGTVSAGVQAGLGDSELHHGSLHPLHRFLFFCRLYASFFPLQAFLHPFCRHQAGSQGCPMTPSLGAPPRPCLYELSSWTRTRQAGSD